MARDRLPFDLNQISEAFRIERRKQSPALENWLKATYELTKFEETFLDQLLQKMEGNVEYWNEEELKMKMVGLLFFLADIDMDEKVKVFFERPMNATISGIELSVVCDCMVATPTDFNYPRTPYFFLQEFKKEKWESNDPEAQMLQAMIIAQHHHQDEKPLYGGYLVGSRWRFATLVGKDYCVSTHFDADERADLFKIVFLLRHIKELALNR